MEITNKKILKIAKAQDNFEYFVKHIFSKSKSLFPNGFISGDLISEICAWLQDNKKTARVSARDHFKSTAFYAHFAWQVLKNWDRPIEGHYFSYQYQMAAYHISKIKQAIKSNEYFDDLIDLKKNAEGVIKFTWEKKDDKPNTITLEPHGLLEFKRGIHSPLIYVDDPFQDPSNKMILTVITKINNIFKQQVLDMVMDQIHVCGTAQTNEDFFFDKDIMSRFSVKVQPAIKDEKNKTVIWPEWKSYDELMAIKREKGEKLFNQEYLCRPTYAEDGFIKKERLYELVNSKLPNVKHTVEYKPMAKEYPEIVGGHDIGKKAHPAHFTAFEVYEGKWIQIHTKFMDGWPYTMQIEYIREAIKNLQIDTVYYDNTRGEFEGFAEQGDLPDEMEPVVFNTKSKYSMAAQLDKVITAGNIEFINDDRTLSQMLMVTNDLQAIETPEGHGDSFWSTALALKHEEAAQPEITIL